jgi:hypothetical protein
LVFLSSEPFPFKEGDALKLAVIPIMLKLLFVDGEMFSWHGKALKAFDYFKKCIKNYNSHSFQFSINIALLRCFYGIKFNSRAFIFWFKLLYFILSCNNPYFGVVFFANEQLTTFKSAIFFVAIEI